MIKRWPLHPKPYHYQLLYSWIEKLAKVYGISYQSFCKNILKLTSEEIKDLSTILPERALSILSEGTGISMDDLRQRDLHTMFKLMCDELYQIIKKDPEAFDRFMSKNVYKP